MKVISRSKWRKIMKKQLKNIACAIALLSLSSNIQSSNESSQTNSWFKPALLCGTLAATTYLGMGLFDKYVRGKNKTGYDLARESLTTGVQTGLMTSIPLFFLQDNIPQESLYKFGTCWGAAQGASHYLQYQRELEQQRKIDDLNRRVNNAGRLLSVIVPRLEQAGILHRPEGRRVLAVGNPIIGHRGDYGLPMGEYINPARRFI